MTDPGVTARILKLEEENRQLRDALVEGVAQWRRRRRWKGVGLLESYRR